MRDLELAWRAFRAAPIVACAVVVSLALGIGANTALFTLVNSLLLRSLPVPDPDRLVTVSSPFALGHGFRSGAGISSAMWQRMEERLQMFDGGFAWAPSRVNLSQGGEVQEAQALYTSGGFFDALEVQPLLGRTYTPADDVPGGGPDGRVAVIGYGLWQRHFGGAADVVGRSLPVDGVPCTIVGVMPSGFFGIEVGQPFDVALPLRIELAIRGSRGSLHDPQAFLLTVMLRLKSGQSLEAATAALRAQQPAIMPPVLPDHLKEPYVLVPARTGTADRSGLRRRYARPLLALSAVVALVLLVACVNIANLLLARASSRRHEMSVRLALGASRGRLIRQLLVESLVLSTIGALAALLFSIWASRALMTALSTASSPIRLTLPIDWHVVAVTAGIAVATALLFGCGPAFRATRIAPIEALKDDGRVAASRAGLSGMLLIVQVALSLVLLVAAGLFVGTFRRLADVPLGFDGDRVLVIDVDTARAHADSATRLDYYHRLLGVVGIVPGVTAAAASTITPFAEETRSPLFERPGASRRHAVTPGYFAAYGMRIAAGRDFEAADSANSGRVVIVSEAYAARFFPRGGALGAPLDPRAGCDARHGPCPIVGIVNDAVFGSPRAGARPTVYVPLAQSAGMGPPGRAVVSISIRAASDSPAQLSRSLAAALTGFDRRLAFSFRELESDVRAALTQERVVAMLSTFFGGLALLLSAVGLYGVAWYSVTRRRIEIGIRVALGATAPAVIRLVLSRLIVLVACGLALGAVVSIWASRFVAALLYGVDPRDPATIAVAAVTLGLVAVLAGSPAALRAALTDPATVLRRG